jgi:hypothetical protein
MSVLLQPIRWLRATITELVTLHNEGIIEIIPRLWYLHLLVAIIMVCLFYYYEIIRY